MRRIDWHGNFVLQPSTNWENIPLGVIDGGDEVLYWDTAASSSALLVGSAISNMGSEHSIIQRNVILHCLQHLDKWRMVGIDPKGVELTPYSHYDSSQMWIGRGFEESLSLLQRTHEQLNERYFTMGSHGVTSFKELKSRARAVMVIIDEASLIMPGVDEDDPRKAEMAGIIIDIARRGRAAGFHLLLSTRHPETVVNGNTHLMECVPYQIFAGRQTDRVSQLLLGNNDAFDLELRGSYMKKHKESIAFRRYFAHERWFEDFLLDQYLASKK